MLNTLISERVLSIDAFRGITIFAMIFVNELAGVSGIPLWMKHMPANADAMTFVDVVFPAFLFIVGMSVPFALNRRLLKGESMQRIQQHILSRTVGLLVLGVFMVNAESGYNEEVMVIPIHLWALLFYGAVILIWNTYHTASRKRVMILRGAGIVMLLVLALLFRGGEDGDVWLHPKWWGILGLIGWAYLVTCILYQVAGGHLWAILVAIGACLGFYILARQDIAALRWMEGQTGHAMHTMITLCGVMVTLVFFELSKSRTQVRRILEALAFAAVLFVAGFVLRPYYAISKVHATPTWALYSAAFCCLIFIILYWIVDMRKVNKWLTFIRPAAANPLLAYIIPYIIYAFLHLLGLSFPETFYQGAGGVIWSLVYAALVMGIVVGLNKMNIRLQL